MPERVEAGRGSWWGASRQAQVAENLDDDRGVFNGRKEGQRPTALGTGGHLDGEDAFESLRPTQAARGEGARDSPSLVAVCVAGSASPGTI